MNNLGKLIKQKRKTMGLNLRDFAKMCDLSHSYLRNLEKGVDPRTGKTIRPTIETLIKIANGLKMPLQVLILAAGYYKQQLQPDTFVLDELLHDDLRDGLTDEEQKQMEIFKAFLISRRKIKDEQSAAGE